MPKGTRNRVLVSGAARQDIAAIVRWTVREFGNDASLRYKALIAQAIRDVGADPDRIGSNEIPDTKGVRSYHLALSRTKVSGDRVKEPRHFIVYCRTKNGAVEIARVLHDGRHILRLLPASYLADGD